MAGKAGKIFNLIGNMGWRYVSFRARHEVLKKTGLLKRKFPTNPAFQQYITLEEWKKQPASFFFNSRADISVPKQADTELKECYDQLCDGKLLMFSSLLTDLGKDYDWVTNPDSGYRYDVNKHWIDIPDFSKEAGDIKFVWEKSRFSYLYDIIRYDYHFGVDCAAQVFGDILSWIEGNPINCGPNYRCSQEMSLRVLNWIFALYYYKDSPALTGDVFNKMQQVIYWHLHHIYNNIDFSRIAVRNNHAITETLTLYLGGLLYPAMPGAKEWKQKGKQWFEEEIAYQVYEDGTFLQFSMNYHRIVAQLLTWAIVLSEKNGERFNNTVYDRARKSVQFLRTCMVEENGWLPNYGANDGALFFKLSSAHYRDYRPQVQALAAALGIDAGLEQSEDAAWYGIAGRAKESWTPANGIHQFPQGGYYIIRESETLTFIKCGGYKDRPSHADNLHLDVWYKGENILLDAGSNKYNTDDRTIRYFSGTASHNTVMLDDKDQMLKGGRFIWYHWTQREHASLSENNEHYVFKGSVHAFTYISKDITHTRTVVKHMGMAVWEIKDDVKNMPAGMQMRQLWHLPAFLKHKISVVAKGSNGEDACVTEQDGWASSLYGQKEKTRELFYSTEENSIDTLIKAD